MEVGSVTDVQLGKFADRVVFSIEIQNEYAYLVRQNSLFWNASVFPLRQSRGRVEKVANGHS